MDNYSRYFVTRHLYCDGYNLEYNFEPSIGDLLPRSRDGSDWPRNLGLDWCLEWGGYLNYFPTPRDSFVSHLNSQGLILCLPIYFVSPLSTHSFKLMNEEMV